MITPGTARFPIRRTYAVIPIESHESLTQHCVICPSFDMEGRRPYTPLVFCLALLAKVSIKQRSLRSRGWVFDLGTDLNLIWHGLEA